MLRTRVQRSITYKSIGGAEESEASREQTQEPERGTSTSELATSNRSLRQPYCSTMFGTPNLCWEA